MSASAKLAIYGAGVLAVFGAAFAVGNTVQPVGLANAEPVEHGGTMESGDGLPGLASSTAGFGIVPSTDVVAAGRTARYEFSIVASGQTVTEFDIEHTKRMHLIAIRRDFVGFVHDHPAMDASGTWSTSLKLDEPGTYRVFADFVVDGDKHTIGTDLFVPGEFDPRALPRPNVRADAGDGYEVELHGEPVAGEESELTFTVRRSGSVVDDLPDHLGAKGHLVALRVGDLAYLHVHADEDRLAFEADFPTAGAYRLFLQFEHGGQVRTASFTIEAEEANR
jgi:hypothetical protein